MKYARSAALLLSAAMATQPTITVAAQGMAVKTDMDADLAEKAASVNEKSADEAVDGMESEEVEAQDYGVDDKDLSQSNNGWVRSGMVRFEDQTEQISFSHKKISMNVDGLARLDYSGRVDVHDITFISSNPSIAQVDVNGYVHGVRKGSATITAWYNGKYTKCKVKVLQDKVPGAVNQTEAFAVKGKKMAAPKMYKARNAVVTSDDNNNVISPKDAKNKKFIANEAGSEKVTISVSDNMNASATVDYFVEDPKQAETSVSVALGETHTLVLDGLRKNAVWKSSKKKVAVVDPNGVVTGLKPGRTIIRAKVNGKTYKYNVTVTSEQAAVHNHRADEEVVEVIRQNKYVELHMHSCGAYDVKQTYDYEKDIDYTNRYQTEDITYRYIAKDVSGNAGIHADGLTDAGKQKNPLTVPQEIDGQKIRQIDDAVLDVADIIFENSYAGQESALPSTLSDHTYTSEDYVYFYYIDAETGKLRVHIVGLTPEGQRKKDNGELPDNIHGTEIGEVDTDVRKQTEDITYTYTEKDASGKYGIHADGLTEAGKQKNPLTVPQEIGGYRIKQIDDAVLNVKDIIFENAFVGQENALPDTLPNHTYISGDYIYNYYINPEDGTLRVNIQGITEEGKKKGISELPDSINGVETGKVEDKVSNQTEDITFTYMEKDASGKIGIHADGLTEAGKQKNPLTVPQEIGGYKVRQIDDAVLNVKDIVFENAYAGQEKALPDTLSNHTYTSGDYIYNYYINPEDGTLRVNIKGITEEGKKKGISELPDSINGVKTGKIESKVSNQTEDITYTYMEKDANGKYGIHAEGLTEAGKKKDPLKVPQEIGGYKVRKVDDAVLNVKDIIFENNYEGQENTLPSTLSDHIYVYDDYKYNYYVDSESGKLCVKIIGVTDEGKAKGKDDTLPKEIHGVKVDDIDPTTPHETGDILYRYMDKDANRSHGIHAYGLTEAGKKKNPLTIPQQIAGYVMRKVDDAVLNAPDVKFENNYEGQEKTLPETLSDHIYSFGDYKYCYYIDSETGKLRIRLIGLTPEGQEKQNERDREKEKKEQDKKREGEGGSGSGNNGEGGSVSGNNGEGGSGSGNNGEGGSGGGNNGEGGSGSGNNGEGGSGSGNNGEGGSGSGNNGEGGSGSGNNGEGGSGSGNNGEGGSGSGNNGEGGSGSGNIPGKIHDVEVGEVDIDHINETEDIKFKYTDKDLKSANEGIHAVGLTEKGSKKNPLKIPQGINSYKVKNIDDAVLDAPDVKFENNYEGMEGILPETLSNHVYSNGDFKYKYYIDSSDGKLHTHIVGLSEEGMKKKMIEIKTSINDVNVGKIAPDIFDPAKTGISDYKVAGVNPDLLPDNISDYQYNNTKVEYRYYKDKSGKVQTLAELTAITAETKKYYMEHPEETFVVPSYINETTVGKWSDQFISDLNDIENWEIEPVVDPDPTPKPVPNPNPNPKEDDDTDKPTPSENKPGEGGEGGDKPTPPGPSKPGINPFKDKEFIDKKTGIEYMIDPEDITKAIVVGIDKAGSEVYSGTSINIPEKVGRYTIDKIDNKALKSHIDCTVTVAGNTDAKTDVVLPDGWEKESMDSNGHAVYGYTTAVKVIMKKITGNGSATSVSEAQIVKVKYGEKLKQTDIKTEDIAGYHIGYYTNEELTTEYNFNEIVKDNFTLYVGVKADKTTKYVVNSYFETINTSTGEHKDYVLGKRQIWTNSGALQEAAVNAVVKTGISDTTVSVNAPEYDGYVVTGYTTSADKDNMKELVKNAGNVYIKPDGTAEINLYYNAKETTVTFEIGSGVQFFDANTEGPMMNQKYVTTAKYMQNVFFFARSNASKKGVTIVSDGAPIGKIKSTSLEKKAVNYDVAQYSFTNGRANTKVTLTQADNTNTINYVFNNPNKVDNDIIIVNGAGKAATNPGAYTVGETVTLNNLTKTGYIFDGWTGTNPSSGVKLNSPSKKVQLAYDKLDDDFTFEYTANWTPIKYEIEFNANGGTGSMENEKFKYDEIKPLTANNFTRTGYTFLGWSKNKDATKADYINLNTVSNMTTKEGDKVTLYAVWQANTYTLTFNSNGANAKCDVTSRDVVYGKTYGTLPTPTRVGYTFDGWYTSINGNTNVSASTVMGPKDVTVYAHWKINTCAITIGLSKPSDIKFDGQFKVTYVNADGENKTVSVKAGDKITGIAKEQEVTIQGPSTGYSQNGKPISTGGFIKTWRMNGVEYANNPLTFVADRDTTATFAIEKNPAFFG